MRAATVAAVAVSVGALFLSACGPGRGAAQRARLELQREQLAASLDRLEARLLDGHARVRGWEELKARHARVSAVACEVNGRHVEDMARLEEEERWQAAAARALRLAAVVAEAPRRPRVGQPGLPRAVPDAVESSIQASPGGPAGAAGD